MNARAAPYVISPPCLFIIILLLSFRLTLRVTRIPARSVFFFLVPLAHLSLRTQKDRVRRTGDAARATCSSRDALFARVSFAGKLKHRFASSTMSFPTSFSPAKSFAIISRPRYI